VVATRTRPVGDRVGIGVAGIGVISALDLPGYLQHPDAEVVAVADPQVDRARERAADQRLGMV
jgi:predicted dehydrogenase